MRDTAGAVVVEEEIEQDSGLKVQVALSSLATQDIFSLLSAVSAVFLLHLVCVSVSRRWRTNPMSSVFFVHQCLHKRPSIVHCIVFVLTAPVRFTDLWCGATKKTGMLQLWFDLYNVALRFKHTPALGSFYR
jgi:hypothetical protein